MDTKVDEEGPVVTEQPTLEQLRGIALDRLLGDHPEVLRRLLDTGRGTVSAFNNYVP